MDQRIVTALPGNRDRGCLEPGEAGAVGHGGEGITQRFDPRPVGGGLGEEREQSEERGGHTRLHYTPPETRRFRPDGARYVRNGLPLSTRQFAQYLGVP